MTIYSNLKRAILMLLVGSFVVATGLPAGADLSKDGGKTSAWVSISGVSLTTGTTTSGSVTIAKGKKKRVLEVDAVVTETTNVVNAIGIIGKVNGIPLEPSATNFQVKEGCSVANPNCTITGRWWLDLDQAELAHPGLIIGQPLVVSIQTSVASTNGTGNFSLRARLVTP